MIIPRFKLLGDRWKTSKTIKAKFLKIIFLVFTKGFGIRNTLLSFNYRQCYH